METFIAWIVLIALGYWWFTRRKRKLSHTAQTTTTTSPDGGGDALKDGRSRLPGKQWVCTRCDREFSVSVDPKTIPRMWWIAPNNQWKSGETAPWACPDCGTYAYTVPR